MYIAHILVASMLSANLSVIESGTVFDKSSHSPPITNLTNYIIPSNTTHAHFYRNAISHVYANYFQNLPILSEIIIYTNEISDIDDYSFVDVPTVFKIDLGNNKLSIIREFMFFGLRVLRNLLYFLENKLMRLYSKPAPIFEQLNPPVTFHRLKKSYLRNYLAHKNGSPIKM